MGLISRVSSRTYRDKSLSVDKKNRVKMNRNFQISRRLLNSIKTDGKGKPIPNAGAWFLRGNPIVKKYLLQGENKWVFQRKPLSWTTKKWAVMLMVPNAGLCYTILNGKYLINRTISNVLTSS